MTDATNTISPLSKMTSPTRLELVRLLPAPPERVRDYFVDGDLRGKWIASGKTDTFEGGKMILHFDHACISDTPAPAKYADEEIMELECTILAYDKPNVFKFSWPEAKARDSVVTVTLTEKGDMTELHLVHERLDDASIHLSILAGWHAHTDILDDILAGRPMRDFWIRDQELEAFYTDLMK